VNATSLRVTLSSGLSLRALAWDGDGTQCLFLHGAGDGAHIWEDLAAAVPEGYAPFALDLRGHGESDWANDGRYDSTTLADDVLEAATILGIERAVLVGHSIGGEVALRVAVAQQLTLGLVLVDSGPELNVAGMNQVRRALTDGARPYRTIAEYGEHLAARHPLVSELTIARLARDGLRRRPDGLFEPKADPAFWQARAARGANGHAGRWRDDALWSLLGHVPCPTLVVRGEASSLLLRDVAERMAHGALRNGTLAVIPVAGHAVPIDNPQAFHEAVTSFLERSRPCRST
jgi:pimeloyl-ACP methyl ester carboxylesterase